MTLILAICCTLLGHEKWAVRDRASVTLGSYGPAAIPYLQHAAGSSDPEVRHRAKTLLGEARRQQIEMWLIAQKELPWIDSAPGVWPLSDDMYIYVVAGRDEATRRGVLHGAPQWNDYRFATAAWLRDRLGGEDLTFGDAAELLRVMRERCAAWRVVGGYPQP